MAKERQRGGQAAQGDISNTTHGIMLNGANGSVVIHHLHIGDSHQRTVSAPVIPEGAICEAQAARLKDLVNEWVVTHNQIKPRNPLTHQAAWLKLNRRIKVATYRATPATAFPEQEKWLLQQAAILRNMPSAPGKDDSWRLDKIKAIKTRSSRTLGDSNIYKPYIKKYFGVDSLTELANDELQRTYSYVFNKKRV